MPIRGGLPCMSTALNRKPPERAQPPVDGSFEQTGRCRSVRRLAISRNCLTDFRTD